MNGAGGPRAEPALGGRQGVGTCPCLLVVDFTYGFTESTSPLFCGTDSALEATAALLESARGSQAPVVFTVVEYDATGRQAAGAFLAKIPSLAAIEPGSRWAQIDVRVAPAPGEPVLTKLWASAFFGTPLGPMLIGYGCDTVVLAGASTSGCVRATAVDAVQHGFRVVVPRQAVADRSPTAHEANLIDIDAKYGDVVDLDEALVALAGSTNV